VNRLAHAALALIACACLDAQAATVCRIRQSGTVAFGAYDVTSPTPSDTALDVVVSCSRDGGPPNVTITVALGPSSTSGSVGSRRMRLLGGSDLLAYNLYRDQNRDGVWGQTSGVDTVTRTINVPNKGTALATFTIYGRLAPLQDVTVGSYADSLQITVTP